MGLYQLNIHIFGRVQGVNFRNNLKSEVDKIGGIVGTVENKDDGSVFAVLQGEEENLNKVLAWAQQGEFPAKVTGMQFEWSEITKTAFNDFKVIRDKSFIKDQIKSFSQLGKRILSPFEKMVVPRHIVIIPDGNRRWAKKHGWKPWVGHEKAADISHIEALLKTSIDLGVEYMSFWAFSTENWNRDPKEIEMLFKLLRSKVKELTALTERYKIRFKHIGRKDRIPEDIIQAFQKLENDTKEFDTIHFQFCIDYGGRYSVAQAVNKIIADGVKEVNEETISNYLETNGAPDPDLIIRTSGEQRLSGIMPFESIYAELYFTNTLFPDFNEENLRLAVLEYSGRKRNFGK